jgi:hypothetical protein
VLVIGRFLPFHCVSELVRLDCILSITKKKVMAELGMNLPLVHRQIRHQYRYNCTCVHSPLGCMEMVDRKFRMYSGEHKLQMSSAEEQCI